MQAAHLVHSVRAFESDSEGWERCLAALGIGQKGLLASVTVGAGQTLYAAVTLVLPLHAIRYDSDADELEVTIGGATPGGAVLRYFVAAPRAIHLEERDLGKVISVDDASGVRTLIHVSRATDGLADPSE